MAFYFRSDMPPEQSHALAEEMMSLARPLAIASMPRESVATLDGVVLLLFARAIRLFDGIRTLLAERLPEEALILGRSLFEDSLRLAELAEHAEHRPQLLSWWVHNSISQKEGLHNDLKSLGLHAPWGEMGD